MNPKYIPFSQEVDRLVTDASKRGEILAAALARAIANVQTLPSSQVDSPASFFNTQVLPQIRSQLSAWNENIVFHTKCAIDYARAFWLLRYQSAHPTSRPLYSGAYGFFDTIAGVSLYFSPDQHSFLNEQKDVILALSSQASYLVAAEMESVSDA